MKKVTLTYDPVWRALEWAKVNCPSYITNEIHQAVPNNFSADNTKIDYFFSDDEDATYFALMWA